MTDCQMKFIHSSTSKGIKTQLFAYSQNCWGESISRLSGVHFKRNRHVNSTVALFSGTDHNMTNLHCRFELRGKPAPETCREKRGSKILLSISEPAEKSMRVYANGSLPSEDVETFGVWRTGLNSTEVITDGWGVWEMQPSSRTRLP